MRSLHTRALAVVQALGSWTEAEQSRYLGKKADELTEAEAARIHRRWTRGSGGQRLSLDQIVARSGMRSRARVTHPGKRNKQVSL